MNIYVSLCLSCLLLWVGSVQAGAGHNHGEDAVAAMPNTPASPRMVMESTQFELVGELAEKNLHLYLDDYATNLPITNANLELEILGERLQAEPEGDGVYHIHLPQALAEGVYPVLATVLTDQASDLLTGELDVHIEGVEENIATDSAVNAVRPWHLGVFFAILSVFLLSLLVVIRRDVMHKPRNTV